MATHPNRVTLVVRTVSGDKAMLNKDQAQHDNNQIHKEARRDEIFTILKNATLPLTVANIVKQTGYPAVDVREILYDMVEDGEVKERAWMYSL